MIRLCVIVTTPFALFQFHQGMFDFFRKNDVDVTGITADGPQHGWLRREGIKTVIIPICRRPSPLKDLVSFFSLWRYLMKHRFDIVHVSTPKAALLGSLAARLSGHRRVVFTLRGRIYENKTGFKRRFYASLDRYICALSCTVVPICRELKTAIIDEGICSPKKIRFLGSGSSNGIDARKFCRTPSVLADAIVFRKNFNIPPDAEIILFVGRLCVEKGIRELLEAFSLIATNHPRAHLVMVGPFESLRLQAEILKLLKMNTRVHYVPITRDIVFIYAASAVLALPSYREGFTNVALEAAAMELPVVTSNVMGCRDAILDGVTGILVPPRNSQALAAALVDLLDHPEKRKALGAKGRERAERDFRQEPIWSGLLAIYEEIVHCM